MTAIQPGLLGVVPFRFQCQRSGRCCTGGTGYVWVEPDELDGLAEARGVSRTEFERTFLREVPDPKDGRLRLSLREGSGHSGGSGDACALLEGRSHCTVYQARPRHCQQYPYWPSILEDPVAFEAARSTCPGIVPLPDPERQELAFEQLKSLYAELDAEISSHSPRCEMSGLCCRFEEAGHQLYATSLETDFAAHAHPQAPAPEAEGRCPYHVRGMCTAREGRPLGCRTYFCDERTEDALQEVHESYLGRIREIEATTGYASSYGPFPAQLAMRGVGETDS
ncbi:MAG: Fe-S-cluster containining protein [Planctomycetota bacterium]|jgi:Fe-S-cluster containining protein